MRKIIPLYLFLIILFSFSFAFLGCSNKQFDDGKESANIIKFGVLSDIHGDVKNLASFMSEFKEQKADAILVLGDTNDMASSVDGKTDYEEIYLSLLRILGSSDVPVFVIPGNHESTQNYLGAVKSLAHQYPALHDLSTSGLYQFKSVMLVPLPGYHLKEYTNPAGFLFSEDVFSALGNMLDAHQGKLSQPLLFVAHGPLKFSTKEGIDVIYSGENVGNPALNELMDKHGIRFGVFGHIHEAGMKGVDKSGSLIKKGEWSETLYFNPGPAEGGEMCNGQKTDGSAGIFEIDVTNNKARYWILQK